MDKIRWWQSGIVYQIYPRSFQDSNGDGVGDLAGISRRLDYLSWLGIDAIWISPIYPSPMADFGYDVSDYCDVDPLFGSLSDFDALLRAVHARGLKLILDFVPNHTSDQHPWFIESRSSRNNPKRDWYIWRDAKADGSPPNNWMSNFGGSAWQWDAASGQYYYHAFLKEQPDLNWRNPAVCQAMSDTLRFWLKRGVDGFRVDVIWHLIKDDQFRDNPDNPSYSPQDPAIRKYLQVYSADRPEVHEIVAGLRKTVDEFDDRLLIGEIYLPLDRLVTYYGQNLEGTHLPFNFQLISAPWNAASILELIDEYEKALPAGGWPNWVLSNHDQKRIASRIGTEQARVAAMLLLTLRGTPTLYYGDELGLEGVDIPPAAVQDPWEKNEPGLGLSRDPSRTPMQWDASANAGFSTGRPWLPLADDFALRNVAKLKADECSLLRLYRTLIDLRRSDRCLSLGSYRSVHARDGVLCYRRVFQQDEAFVALNMTQDAKSIELPAEMLPARVALSTHLDHQMDIASPSFALRPNEGVVVRRSLSP